MVLATKRAVGSEYGYPIRQDAPERARKVKARARRRTSPVAGIMAIALLFMIGMAYTFLQAAEARLIWEVNQIKQINASIQMENEKIKLEAAKLKSLDRIELIAASKLQMVKEPGIEYLAFQGGVSETGTAAVSVAAEAPQSSPVIAEKPSRNKFIETIAAVFNKGTPDRG